MDDENLGGIPKESREHLSRLSGGPLLSVARAFGVLLIVGVAANVLDRLKIAFPNAPDMLLRVAIMVVSIAVAIMFLCVVGVIIGMCSSLLVWLRSKVRRRS